MKKILSLTMALAMLGTALTGCGSKDAAAQTPAENTQQTAPVQQEQRQSQAQIGVISAPICAFCRRSLGEFSVVSVQTCPLFSDSGSKLGQKLSMNGLQSGNPRHRCFIFEPHPSHTLERFTFPSGAV